MEYQKAGDKTAIVLSGMCALHCLALPMALIAFPALASTVVGDEHFHALLMWLIIPASLLALTLGCRIHKDLKVIVLGGVGLGVLLLTAIAGHDLLGESGERIATVLGSTFLIWGHLRNHRLCRLEHCME